MLLASIWILGICSCRVLLGIPYQGIMNQLNCLFRAAAICKFANLTLAVPPIISQDANGGSLYLPPSLYFRLDYVFRGIPYVLWNNIDLSDPLLKIPVILHDGWKNQYMLGKHANLFIMSHIQSKAWFRYSENLSKLSGLNDIINQIEFMNETFTSFGNFQHTLVGKDAVHLLERMFFTTYLRKEIQELRKALPFPLRNYTAVHWRRGDFRSACLKNKSLRRCFPDIQDVPPLAKFTRIMMATNENEESQLKILRDMFCLLNDYTYPSDNPIKRLLIDFYFMLDSSQFIGNSYSTISRNAAIIRKHLNKSTTLF